MTFHNTNRLIGAACLHDAKESKNGRNGAWRLTTAIAITYHFLLSITPFARHTPQNHIFFSRARSQCLSIGSVTRRMRGNTNRYSLKAVAKVARSGMWGIHLCKNWKKTGESTKRMMKSCTTYIGFTNGVSLKAGFVRP